MDSPTQEISSRLSTLFRMAVYVAVIWALQTAGALAQGASISFSGTIQGAATIDSNGLFGPAGANLAGDTFQASISEIPSDFVCQPVQIDPQQTFCYPLRAKGAFVVSVTINGITQAISASGIQGSGGAGYFGPSNAVNFEVWGPVFTHSIDIQYASVSNSPSINSLPAPQAGSGIEFVFNLNPYEVLNAQIGPLYILSPFLLASNTLSDINLQNALVSSPFPNSYSATGLVADGTSAAIGLLDVGSQSSTPVKFSAQNAVLLPYAPHFMAFQPATGSPTVTVPPRAFVTAGGAIYAPVLIQAPADQQASFTQPVILVANQGTNSAQQASIPLLPPPVVFVHGFMGGASTLQYTQDFLKGVSPWNLTALQAIPDYLLAVDYSTRATYDDFFNPAVTGTLSTSVASVLSDLNDQGIVAGRVDLVVHSMGGLIARAFATTPPYYTIGSRHEGAVHHIITLDTPETGSDVATFMVTDGNNPLLSALESVCMPGTLLKACDALLHIPVLGQMYSLQPNYIASLKRFASPDLNIIPFRGKATWHALAAIAPTNSALEFLLDDLVGGVSEGATVNSVLGTTQHDGVVTLASQLSGASPFAAGSVTLSGLSHTSASFLNRALAYMGYSDANVTKSETVNQYVACWLAPTIMTNTCPTSAVAANTSPSSGSPLRRPGFVSGAMIPVNENSAVLGKSFEITINRPGALAIFVSEYDGNGHVIDQEELSGKLLQNGYTVASITPYLLGKVEFVITAAFKDHTVSVDRIKMQVRPEPGVKPELRADRNFGSLTLVRSIGAYLLDPVAVFPGLDRPVPLSGLASYTIPANRAGLAISSKGALSAALDGQGKVVVSFDGAQAELPVRAVH